MKTNRKIWLTIILTGMSMPMFGQETVVTTQAIGSFFISIIAGILLAFAFQFLLTNLAVATGISAIGDVRKKSGSDQSSSSSSSSDDDTFTGVKISAGMGIFLMVTMSVSLFFASFLAVRLSLVPGAGLILGLVIWAGYLLLGLYIDSKLISSLTGSLFAAVKGALSSGAAAITGLFTPSPSTMMKDTAEATVKAVHDEIRQEFDFTGIQSRLEEYISKLEPQRIDVDNVQDKLADLIHNIEVKEQIIPGDPEATRKIFFEVAGKQKGFSEKDKQKLKNAYDNIQQAMKKEGTRSEKAAEVFDKMTPGTEQQAKEYRMRVAQYLRDTGRKEVHPDALENDLNRILNNPKAAPDIVMARIDQLDRETLKAMITSVDGISEEKADHYLDKAEKVMENIRSQARESGSRAGSIPGEVMTAARETTEEMRKNAAKAVQEWFDRMEREELQYDELKYDVQQMLDDPKAIPEILQSRLNQMDRDSLIALLSNNRRISREQAEKIVDKIEEARDTVISKSREIENRVKQKMAETREAAIRQAEGVRRTAASAAWWLLAASIVSGAASAAGGLLAF